MKPTQHCPEEWLILELGGSKALCALQTPPVMTHSTTSYPTLLKKELLKAQTFSRDRSNGRQEEGYFN